MLRWVRNLAKLDSAKERLILGTRLPACVGSPSTGRSRVCALPWSQLRLPSPRREWSRAWHRCHA